MIVIDLRELDIRHLTALVAVADTGTFGRAAEQLGYTQSAVSQQVAALERMVGAPLFDRPGGPRPPTLTPLGRRLLVGARELLGRVDSLAAELEQFVTGEVGRVTVGSFQSVATTMLPVIVGEMRREWPGAEVRVVQSEDDAELVDAMRSGRCDVSFVVGQRGDDLATRHLLEDPWVIMARPGQFPDGPLPLTAIEGEPMIGQQFDSCHLVMEENLRSAGLSPDFVFHSSDNGTVAAMVREGMGIAVMPVLCIDTDDDRLALHPIEPAVPARMIDIAWIAGRTLSPLAERFIDVTVQVAQRFAADPVAVRS